MLEYPFESDWGDKILLLTMDTTFKYKNQIITTPNLEKKLKRMKLTLSDIEIIETPVAKQPPKTTFLYPIEHFCYYKHPELNEWTLQIAEQPKSQIIVNNQILKFDKEYTLNERRKLEQIRDSYDRVV